MSTHGDGDDSQREKPQKMKGHFYEPIFLIEKLGRHELEEGDMDEDASGQWLK